MDKIFKILCTAFVALANHLWGGFDVILVVLLTVITMDYITGVIAGIYNKELSSQIGFNGLLKKVVILIVVALAHLIGVSIGIEEIRSLVIAFYIANEGISILENAARMGVPLHPKMLEILKQLKDKED